MNVDSALADQIVRELRSAGPLVREEVRSRLTVASTRRWVKALRAARAAGRVEIVDVHKAGVILRVPGDKRPLPDLLDIWACNFASGRWAA